MNGLKLAEREGFEPSVQVAPDNCLAGSPVRPLQHLSAVVAGPPIVGSSGARSQSPSRWLADAPIPAMLGSLRTGADSLTSEHFCGVGIHEP